MAYSLDPISQAVATIVASVTPRLGVGHSEAERATTLKLAVELTDQLTRAFAKALIDANMGKP